MQTLCFYLGKFTFAISFVEARAVMEGSVQKN